MRQLIVDVMDPPAPIFYTKQEVTKQYSQELARDGHCLSNPSIVRHRSVFLQVLGPFIFWLRAIGGFPYTIHNDVVQVRLCSCWTLYSLLIMSLQIFFLVISSNSIFFSDSDVFDNKLFAVINIVVTICQAFGPLTLWYETPQIAKYFSKWYSYQEELRGCGIILDSGLKKWRIVCLAISIPYALGISYFQSKVHGGYIHIPAVLLLHANSFLALSLWYFSGFFIRATSRRIIQRIKELAQDNNAAEIAICRKTWLTLADLTTDLGNILGPTLLEFLLLACAVVIINCYSLIFIFHSSLNGTAHEVDAVRIFFVVTPSIAVFILCEFGHRCTSAVGQNMLLELLRINILPQREEFQREVNVFIQTVWLRYPDMMLSGFLTLNRRLFVSLVSGGITYMIVLVQFRSSEE